MKLAARIEALEKHYPLAGETVKALRGVSLEIPQGDYIAVMGPSGSGKSTLLNLLGCLDRPTKGRYFLEDEDVAGMNDNELSDVRARRIGFIFQSYNLVPQLDVLENIELPLVYARRISTKTRQRCRELAYRVGLEDRLRHRPAQLSGGQQQRVAIARSLANDPAFILADEPTGNLDSETSADILELMDQLNEEGRTLILVTHEAEVAERTRRVVRLRDGEIGSDTARDPL